MATYLELSALRRDPDFAARTEIAVAKFAVYKMDENPATAGHALAMKWAFNAIANPGSVAAGLLPALMMDFTLQSKAATPADITDGELQVAVEVAINRILNS